MSKSTLGKGLASLIPMKKPKGSRTYQTSEGEQILLIPIDKIFPNPHQPRKNFNSKLLEELAVSIGKYGIIEPLILTKKSINEYELVAGERRLQAAKMLKLRTVPAIIRTVSSQQKLEISLVENIQRSDLDPIEQAEAFAKLASQFNLTQEEISRRTGKSRSEIANTLRLLELPEIIQKAISGGKISQAHGRTLLGIKNPQKQEAVFNQILKNHWSVRQTEEKVNEIKVSSYTRSTAKKREPEIRELEENLSEVLGTKVIISKKGKAGKIIIEFYSLEEFGEIVKKLLSKNEK